MLTQEQLKNYREQLSQHFSKLNSEKLDTRGIIGSLLTALGIERSRVIPDAVKRLNFEKADAKKVWSGALPKPGQIKPFDVLLKTRAGSGELEPANFNWERLTGEKDPRRAGIFRRLYEMTAGKRDNHAYIVLPYERTVNGKTITELVPTVMANYKDGAKVIAHPRTVAAIKAMERAAREAGNKGVLAAIGNLPSRYSHLLGALDQEAKNTRPFSSWNEMIEANYGGIPEENALQSFMDEAGTSRFLRFKQELSPDEIAEAKRRVMGIMGGSFHDHDNTISGVKNFLFGPGKAGKKFNPNVKIPTCSGGVCHVFEGLRDMPSVSRAMPQDLAMHPSFQEVGNFFRGKASPSRAGSIGWVSELADDGSEFMSPMLRQSQEMVSKNSIRAARRALATRFGMAAAPLGLGGFMLGSSPTFQNMVNPLAEQGKLIGQKVQDYVNKARNHGS